MGLVAVIIACSCDVVMSEILPDTTGPVQGRGRRFHAKPRLGAPPPLMVLIGSGWTRSSLESTRWLVLALRPARIARRSVSAILGPGPDL